MKTFGDKEKFWIIFRKETNSIFTKRRYFKTITVDRSEICNLILKKLVSRPWKLAVADSCPLTIVQSLSDIIFLAAKIRMTTCGGILMDLGTFYL